MTFTDQPIDPAIAWAAIEAQALARARLANDARPINKAAILGALSQAGIGHVTVAFDGAGDSGQIEDIAAYADGVWVVLPAVDVEIARPLGDGSDTVTDRQSLGDAVVEVVYDLLEETHGGWENNEGAWGEFTFDVAGDAIRLDYNERIESSDYSSHAW